MTEKVAQHSWVEIHHIVLQAGERAPQVPEDTQRVPLEMNVKGFLMHAARVGERVEIMTPAGRTMTGTLTVVNPAYTHTFGAPIPALASIGSEVRAMLNEEDKEA